MGKRRDSQTHLLFGEEIAGRRNHGAKNADETTVTIGATLFTAPKPDPKGKGPSPFILQGDPLLLCVPKILGDLIVPGAARDRDGNECACVFLLEERRQRFEKE